MPQLLSTDYMQLVEAVEFQGTVYSYFILTIKYKVTTKVHVIVYDHQKGLETYKHII